jgi:hypothetical protein
MYAENSLFDGSLAFLIILTFSLLIIFFNGVPNVLLFSLLRVLRRKNFIDTKNLPLLAFGALGAFGAFGAFGALGALGAFGAFGALGALGALGAALVAAFLQYWARPLGFTSEWAGGSY